jgi:hypothetical protein
MVILWEKKMEREPQKQVTDDYRNNFDAIFNKQDIEKAINDTIEQHEEFSNTLHEAECGK